MGVEIAAGMCLISFSPPVISSVLIVARSQAG